MVHLKDYTLPDPAVTMVTLIAVTYCLVIYLVYILTRSLYDACKKVIVLIGLPINFILLYTTVLQGFRAIAKLDSK